MINPRMFQLVSIKNLEQSQYLKDKSLCLKRTPFPFSTFNTWHVRWPILAVAWGDPPNLEQQCEGFFIDLWYQTHPTKSLDLVFVKLNDFHWVSKTSDEWTSADSAVGVCISIKIDRPAPFCTLPILIWSVRNVKVNKKMIVLCFLPWTKHLSRTAGLKRVGRTHRGYIWSLPRIQTRAVNHISACVGSSVLRGWLIHWETSMILPSSNDSST